MKRLQADLARVLPGEWAPHYNERDYGGDDLGGEWSGAALRSSSGMTTDLIVAPPTPNALFRDTPLLARCDYFREVLAALRCPLKSVRLLSLGPGSYIREHSDHALGFEDGEIRIHIPVETSPAVEFYVCGERLRLEAGGCYYVNVNLPHRVNNRSAFSRVHLVIDAEVNVWVRDVFHRSAGPIGRSALPPGNLDEFRRLVLGDEPLQQALRGIPDRREFISRTINAGLARGFDFNEGDVDAGFRSSPTVVSQAPAGWIPVKVQYPAADWIYTGPHRFTEPFFGDSMRVCLRDPFAALFRATAPLPPADPDACPAGLIFHMSRCGSTLVSQMLAAMRGAHVLCEVPAIDEVVQAPLPVEVKIEALRRLVGALTCGTNCFIKLDAWHIHSLPLIRAAFPDSPWIFVCRDPVEVLVSHLRMPGSQMIPGDTADAAAGLTRTQWCAQVIGNFLRRALEFRSRSGGLFVEYRDLPGAVTGPIAKHFGLRLTAEDAQGMLAAARRDAKNPSVSFQSDTRRKQEAGRELTAEPAVTALSALYRELIKTPGDSG